MIFDDGSYVRETFASAFKALINGLAKTNEPVNFRVNVQGGENISISCNNSYACEHISFMDALEAEISTHGVAIVVATDYRTKEYSNTVFVVCDDEL